MLNTGLTVMYSLHCCIVKPTLQNLSSGCGVIIMIMIRRRPIFGTTALSNATSTCDVVVALKLGRLDLILR